MELFWTQITDAQPARPARTKAHGSAWGVSLLAYAVRAVWGIDLPETAELPGGKPYFPACPQLHFSVSHTRTAALVAVSGRAGRRGCGAGAPAAPGHGAAARAGGLRRPAAV